MGIEIKYKPIIEWPGDLLSERFTSSFKSPWGKTLKLLERELAFLQAENIVFQVAVREREIRTDGGLKAGVKLKHPGVIITFNSEHGPLSYYSDWYDQFATNVRGIALALEALRAVDRHGVNKRGAQYDGYKRLPAAGETLIGRPKIETPEEAADFVSTHANVPAELLLSNKFIWEASYKECAKKLHPDNQETGNDGLFVDLQDAAVVLKKHHGEK